MYGDDRGSPGSVGIAQVVMTALDPVYIEAGPSKSADHIVRRQRRQPPARHSAAFTLTRSTKGAGAGSLSGDWLTIPAQALDVSADRSTAIARASSRLSP